MKNILILFFFVTYSLCSGQNHLKLYLSGGLSNLFEAEVANEASGTFLGIGVEIKKSKFLIFASFEKISCQNNSKNGVPQFQDVNGEWIISRYKGYINLERRDWAFEDVVVDEKLFSAGNRNLPGNEQTFDSNNFILGVGYELYRKKKFSISPRVGLALNLIDVSAVNRSYSTELNEIGKNFVVRIPTYLKYLYLSSYISVPFEFDITKNISIGIVGSLYRAPNLYLPSLGINLKTNL